MSHPFGDLLRQYLARKRGLSQTRLAHMVGYDQSVLARMAQGKKDLTGPSGRSRITAIIAALRDEGVLKTLGEANALLKAAGLPPLYDGQPVEAVLLHSLKPDPSLPALPATHPVRNLPAPLNTFIGREPELAEVKRLLGATRLLTLTGSGGCGKTRLALEVANLAPGEVWLVELAALADASLISETVVAALGLHVQSRTALAVLIDHLRDRSALLILDNCEHLLQGCAELAVALLRHCPHLRLLVTSRELLNVPGEVAWRVPPLAPDDAMQLFVERARAARPDFALTPGNTPVVAHICLRLDGMPLALELAAARLRAFTVEQIATRVDDMFRELTGGSRTALPRQQTLRATIDWSYDLLTAEERALFSELSVFAGGWTLEAAEAVHGPDAAELLEQLVNKSLVLAEQRSEQRPAAMRYRLLETIRQYAHERLVGQTGTSLEPASRRHAEYYADRFEAAQSSAGDADEEASWVSVVLEEIDNLRASMRWVTEHGEWALGTRLIDATWYVLSERSYGSEITAWIQDVMLSGLGATDKMRAEASLRLGWLAVGRGDMVGCCDWFEQASALAHRLEDEDLIANADGALGFTSPDYDMAREVLNRVIQQIRNTGRWTKASGEMAWLGFRMFLHGEVDQAIAVLGESVDLARSSGHRGALSNALRWLGRAHFDKGEYPRARMLLEESVQIYRQRRSAMYGNSVIAMTELGTTALYQGDEALARQVIAESVPYWYRMDNLERVAQGLTLAASLAEATGDLVQAARLLAATATIRRDHHTHGVFERELFAEYERRLPAVQAALDPAAFERAWTDGQRLTLDEAISEALSV